MELKATTVALGKIMRILEPFEVDLVQSIILLVGSRYGGWIVRVCLAHCFKIDETLKSLHTFSVVPPYQCQK